MCLCFYVLSIHTCLDISYIITYLLSIIYLSIIYLPKYLSTIYLYRTHTDLSAMYYLSFIYLSYVCLSCLYLICHLCIYQSSMCLPSMHVCLFMSVHLYSVCLSVYYVAPMSLLSVDWPILLRIPFLASLPSQHLVPSGREVPPSWGFSLEVWNWGGGYFRALFSWDSFLPSPSPQDLFTLFTC